MGDAAPPRSRPRHGAKKEWNVPETTVWLKKMRGYGILFKWNIMFERES